MTPTPQYVYRAALVACHDGDTCTLLLDLGFAVQAKITVRTLGINAPELATEAGQAAQRAALAWLMGAGSGAWPLVVASHKAATPIGPDKYGGRWDALIYRQVDGAELGAVLLAAGLAKPWHGRGVKPA